MLVHEATSYFPSCPGIPFLILVFFAKLFSNYQATNCMVKVNVKCY